MRSLKPRTLVIVFLLCLFLLAWGTAGTYSAWDTLTATSTGIIAPTTTVVDP